MGIDSSVYNNARLPDLLGMYREGRDWRQKQDALQKQKQKEDAMRSIYQLGPDGRMSINQEALRGFAQVDPQTANQIMNQAEDREVQRAGLEFDRDHKKQQLRLMEMQARAKFDEARNPKPPAGYRYGANGVLEPIPGGPAAVSAEKAKEDRFVPGFGFAQTADDAKKLKEGAETKNKFDRQVNELIGLRKKHGVEYLNRDAVGRGKQLSKDLLLTYKNLAKLGVLSKADEAIVAAIIPEDPLGHDGTPFQDPILHQLTKFKSDLDDDFNMTLKTRLREPVAGAGPQGPPPQAPKSLADMSPQQRQQMALQELERRKQERMKAQVQGGNPNGS